MSITQTDDFFFDRLIDMRRDHTGDIASQGSDLLDRARGEEHVLLCGEQSDRFDVTGKAAVCQHIAELELEVGKYAQAADDYVHTDLMRIFDRESAIAGHLDLRVAVEC